MSKGPYLHSSKNGWTVDGVPEGSSTKLYACESREMGQRALNAADRENEGHPIDRFLVVRRLAEEASR